MAEIRIEKKKGVPAWVLLLALVLLALLVWAVLTMRGNRPEPPSDMAVVAWSLSSVPVAAHRARRNHPDAVRLTRGGTS